MQLLVRSIFLLFFLGTISSSGLGDTSMCNQTSENSESGLNYFYEKPGDGVIRILTYNIRNCIGMDGKTDFVRVADVINRINPHVVALQEVDSETRRMDGVDVLKILAENTNMHHSYGPAISYQVGKYGNGVLSLEKPLSTKYIPLPGRQERRSLLMVEFKDYTLWAKT